MAVSLGGANRGPQAGFGLSWDHGKRARTSALVLSFFTAVALTLPATFPAAAAPAPLLPVIVREAPDAGDHPEALVERLGGRVGTHLELIDGFSAQVPGSSVATLSADPTIYSVTPDTKIRLLQLDDSFSTETGDTYLRVAYQDGLYFDDDGAVALDDSTTLKASTTDSTATSLSSPTRTTTTTRRGST